MTKRHYSGALSMRFWKRVNRLPEPVCGHLYALGCVLQNAESHALISLEKAEAAERERNAKRARK